jgi:hypothetical protein
MDDARGPLRDEVELVLRGEYLSGRGLHDGDVVRVLPGTAHWAWTGDLVAAASPEGALVVGVLAWDGEPGASPPHLVSDWDGPGTLLCAAAPDGAAPVVLGLARPVRLVKAGNRYQRLRRGRRLTAPGWTVRRVPLPFRRAAREPARPLGRWAGVLVLALAPLAGVLGRLDPPA